MKIASIAKFCNADIHLHNLYEKQKESILLTAMRNFVMLPFTFICRMKNQRKHLIVYILITSSLELFNRSLIKSYQIN